MNIKPLRACPFCEARAIASDGIVTIFHKKDCHLWSYNNMDHGIERFGIHDLSKWDNRPLERQMLEALKEYGHHENSCLRAQWREGKPTDEPGYDGYKTLFGYDKNEKWYGRNDFPPCSCGYLDAIKAFEGEPG